MLNSKVKTVIVVTARERYVIFIISNNTVSFMAYYYVTRKYFRNDDYDSLPQDVNESIQR